MGMAIILFYDAKLFKQLDIRPLTEGPKWILVIIGEAVSDNKTFKDYKILYMYIARGHGQIIPGDKILTVTESVCYFDHTF